MSNGSYVWSNEALVPTKTDTVSIPVSANPANYIQGSDFNRLMEAIEDLRVAMWKGGGRISAAATAPTTGTYEKGDIVFNSNPAEGANLGWVCTVAGTPGTFLEFAAISSDVLNGGGGAGGGGASDITEPERLIGTNKAELSLYPSGLGAGRKGQVGFIAASSIDLEIKNENTGDADIILTPGGTGDVVFNGAAGHGFDATPSGWVAGGKLYGDEYLTYSGTTGGSSIRMSTEELRLTGSDEARYCLYPDGSLNRKGYLGFVAGGTALELKNEHATKVDVQVSPGAGGKLYLGSSATQGFKGINVFSTTDNWPALGDGSGEEFLYTVAGVSVGDIILGVTNSALTPGVAGTQIFGYVTGANTVSVEWRNYTQVTQDPASGTIKIVWMDLT